MSDPTVSVPSVISPRSLPPPELVLLLSLLLPQPAASPAVAQATTSAVAILPRVPRILLSPSGRPLIRRTAVQAASGNIQLPTGVMASAPLHFLKRWPSRRSTGP